MLPRVLIAMIALTAAQPFAARAASPQDSAPARKLALLVAIDAYGASPGVRPEEQWRPLRGTRNDARALAAELRRQGFDVRVLEDAAATREAIVRAFREHLVAQAVPGRGDVALFHFSGHGQQVPDDDADEADGYDEALVPIDNRGTRDPSGHLRDDALRGLLTELGARTRNVVLLFDACHSGGASRPLAVRGAPATLPPAERRGRGDDGAGGLLAPAEATEAGYVVLAAARSDQWAAETRTAEGVPMGAFTAELVRALRDAEPRTTYREVLERVSLRLSAAGFEQSPQLEGDADKLLFSGRWSTPPAYLLARPVAGGPSWRVEAGLLHGLAPGAELALFGIGAQDLEPARALLRVRVVAADAGSATASPVDPARPSPPELGDGAWAVPAGGATSAARLFVAMRVKAPTLEAALKALPTIGGVVTLPGGSPTDVPDLVVEAGSRPGLVRILDQDGRPVPIPRGPNVPMDLEFGSDAPDLGDLVKQAIEARVRRERLLALTGPGGAAAMPIALSLTRVEADSTGACAARVTRKLEALPTDGTGRIAAFGGSNPGDAVEIAIANHGLRPAWVALLGLNPDGSIDRLYPDTCAASDEAIAPGGRRVLRPFRFTGPEGPVLLVALATARPIDVRGLAFRVQSRDLASPGLTPLEELLLDALDGSRARPLVAARREAWGTAAARFVVVER